MPTLPTTANTKAVTRDAAPHLSAPHLTALLAKPPELLTVAELQELLDACKRSPLGSDPAATLGSILV